MNFKYLAPIVIAFSFVSCGKSDKKNDHDGCNRNVAQVVKINIGSEPQTLNPMKARQLSDLNLTKMFFEGLTRADKEGNVTLALAKNIQSSNSGMTYTITLRESKWSNGSTLTANDFLYSWKKALSPSFPSDYAYQLFVIKNAKAVKEGTLPSNLFGVEAKDAHTLVIKLEKPVPFFEKLLAMPIFFPIPEALDRSNPNWASSADTYVCNGPVILQAWSHHDKIVAEKNPNYWDKSSVRLKTIDMMMISDDTGLQMFENGDLDLQGSPFSTLPTDSLGSLKNSDELQTLPALSTFFIRMNTEHGPLASEKVRKALALSINRDELVEHVTMGHQVPTTALVPLSMGLSASPFFTDNDSSQANIFLDEGLEDLSLGKEAFDDITLTYGTASRSHRIAQCIQQQWFENLGLLVKLEALEPKVLLDHLSNKNFHLACSDWIADYNDPISFLEIFKNKSVGTNNTGWESPAYMQAIADSYTQASLAERLDLLKTSEEIIMNEMPIIPVYNNTWLYMKKSGLKGLIFSNEGHLDFKYAHQE